ncbi:MAG: MerR family transcriptional regulator [Rhodoferax sp.]|nr:MerR family transcriptional regulator [Rhodoferax sp.]
MWIGELSERSGVSRDTIRFYEKRGLLQARHRDADSDYRVYDASSVQRLAHIQQLKGVGFTLQDIASLLGAADSAPSCATLPARLAQKVLQLETQMAHMKAQHQALLAVQRACDGDCTAVDGMPSCVPGNVACAA